MATLSFTLLLLQKQRSNVGFAGGRVLGQAWLERALTSQFLLGSVLRSHTEARYQQKVD